MPQAKLIPNQKVKFTKSLLRRIKNPESGQTVIRDTEVEGLKLRVGARTKTLFFEKRVRHAPGRKRIGKVPKVTIGKFENWDLEEARKMARKLSLWCDEGKDPRTELKKERAKEAGITPDLNIEESELEGPMPVTLGEAIERFFDVATLRPYTVYKYRQALDGHFRDWFDRTLESLTIAVLRTKHKEMLKRGSATTKKALDVLSSVWNTAKLHFEVEDQRPVPQNPIKLLDHNGKGYQKEPKRTVIRRKNLGQLIDALLDIRTNGTKSQATNADRFLVSLFLGFRDGETCNLRWEFVSFDHGTITFPGELVKNGREHKVPFGPFIRKILEERYENREDMENPFVFLSPYYKKRKGYQPVNRNGCFNALVSNRVGFKVHPHALRRTFASFAELEPICMPRPILKMFLNHVGNVTDLYVQRDFDPEPYRKWAKKVEKAFLNELGIFRADSELKSL
ncbi:Integrase family protein [Sulfidibacter corallicola]|uniref:Integrase family protein n=1 Tax=Sulfidibacter corallicola TaxID=2818388 RepID=A0A8A4TLD1_SULCO|nr:tyrosine-type recombinase/integrase [Sulfidibacter corallicola]QTD49691.1 integrase family protein [Sulfidibacter corallicola]